jgi:hypothetical protein
VCALLSGGGYAEKVVVPAGQLLPVPEGVSLTDAAGLPEVACTVWSTVFMTSHLSPGESFLVRKLPLSFHSCALEDLVLTTQSVYIYMHPVGTGMTHPNYSANLVSMSITEYKNLNDLYHSTVHVNSNTSHLKWRHYKRQSISYN